MKYYLLGLLILLSNGIHSQTLQPFSVIESTSLKMFLHVLLEQSEGGYVLFNKKPICIHGYYLKDSFRVNSENHKESVALKEGALFWQKIKKDSSDIIIHVSQKEDPQIRGYAYVLVVNVPLFHQVINENLSLFQYVLGPSITSQSLLNALIIEDQPFHTLLKYDKVLIGILLGFGTQNSIYGSRMENIIESTDKETPPFLIANLNNKESDQEYLPFTPSLGFKTINDELSNYSNKITLSSQKLADNKPNFIFGWLKSDSKNKKLIDELEKTQEKTQELLASENFEIGIFKKLIGNNNLSSLNEQIDLKIDENEINKIIAKGIWESLNDYDHEYLSDFIEGMNNQECKNLNVDRLAYFSNYLSDFTEAKDNLKTANIYFQFLSNDKDFHFVEPNKLCFKTIKIDEKHKEICEGTLVTLTYSILEPLGHCIGHGSYERINLKNTIPGFAHGIKGMHVGETREIFIHPSLAYGFDVSSIDKCIYLKAIVTLIEVHNERPLSEIKPLNLDFLLDPETLELRQIKYKNGLKVKGAIIAAHLKKNEKIDLSQVKDYLSKFYNKKEKYIPTTPEEQNLINHIHWNIYWPIDESDSTCSREYPVNMYKNLIGRFSQIF